MIGYITLGTNDIGKASSYYDALFKTIGASRIMEADNFVAWGTSAEAPAISVFKPHDGKPATVGNGVMISIILEDSKQVDDFHAKALELGGSDEGAPGVRNDGGLYISYFRDLDGNKLSAFTMPKA